MYILMNLLNVYIQGTEVIPNYANPFFARPKDKVLLKDPLSLPNLYQDMNKSKKIKV